MRLRHVRRASSFSALILAACSGGEADVVPAPVATARPARAPKVAQPAKESAKRETSSLLALVPESSIVVLRSPDVSKLDDAWRRTAVRELLDSDDVRRSLGDVGANARAALRDADRRIPGLADLVEILPELEGELVVAYGGLDATKERDANAFPGELVVLFDARSGGERLKSVLQPMLERLVADPSSGFELAKKGLGFHGGDERAWVDGSVEGDRWSLVVGARPLVEKRRETWRSGTAKSSFDASHLVRATRDGAGAGDDSALQVYVQLSSVWPMVAASAPADVQRFVTASGLGALEGVSFSMALGAQGLDESIVVASPRHSDLLSRVLTSKPMDVSIARWMPSELEQASVASFDLGSFWTLVVGALPHEAQVDLDAWLADTKKRSKLDLKTQLVENLGPTFAWGSRGGFLDTLQGKPSQLCVAIQIADKKRAQSLVDACVAAIDARPEVREELFAGERYHVLELDRVPGSAAGRAPLRQVAWCITDTCLFVATDPGLVKRGILASRTAERSAHAALATGLEQAGPSVWLVSATNAKGKRPAAIAVGRRTEDGLAIEARGSSGELCFGPGTLALPIVASVAIPKLMAARLEANEAAAVSSLRAIASAEEVARSTRMLDADGDGLGENLWMGELTGTSPLRGSTAAIDPPLLPPSFREHGRGCAEKSGYVFRVDLPTKDGSASSAAPGLPPAIRADAAEISFMAYAWPIDRMSTGNAVFAIDQHGLVYTSDNRGENQSYSGVSKQPDPAASLPRIKSEAAGQVVWRGIDGGMWRALPTQKP